MESTLIHASSCTTPEHRRLLSSLPTTTHHSPPSSSTWRGVVHGDCADATFFTIPSRLPAAILPLHCTWVLLVGYRSFPPGRPWMPAAPCFVSGVFQKLFPSVPSVRCVCCNGYIRMLQVYVSSVSVVSDVCFTCFIYMFHVFHLAVAKGSDVAHVAMATHVCFKYMFQCFICSNHMLQMYVPNVSTVSDACFMCFI